MRDGIKAYSNWPTIPQLYVKGEFVGGCDIVREMFQAGELQQTLKDKGVAVKAERLTIASRRARAVGNVLLIIAAIVDVALAALLIGVSGFLFGSGPESMHGGTLLTAAYAAAVIACMAAPVAGFILNARGKTAARLRSPSCRRPARSLRSLFRRLTERAAVVRGARAVLRFMRRSTR